MAHATPEDLKKALEYHFGHSEFRPHQLDAVQATLAGRDSLLILPTGGGKSMTFQLPALAKGNCFTVVVGPLMALAKDQVDSCLDLGIDARVWNSDTSDEAKRSIQSDLVSDEPDMRLLYTTPESLRNPVLRGYLKEAYDSGTLLSFAIDEAHCVSEWGHDFRPAYLELASLKTDFPNTPIAALTASCTSTVEEGIIKLLRLHSPLLIRGGFNRPNISYKVLFKELIGGGKQDDQVEHLVDFIKQRQGQCGIIYARLRATCDWLGGALGSCDLDVGVYHAGKDAARRRKVQQEWCEGGLDIVVATVAFGMGIDRADVRYWFARWVVHWDVPSSLEGFYQESGRGGRDGQPSEAVLYVSADDLDTITKLEKGSRAGSASAVAGFCCQGGCKRRKLLDYFGQRRGPCDASTGELLCDHCSQPAQTRQQLQEWEQQLRNKAVAHALRQKQQKQQKQGDDGDEQAGDAAQQDEQQEGKSVTAAAAAAAGDAEVRAAGWQAGSGIGCEGANSSTCGSSSRSQQSRPRLRAGAWVPARTRDSTAATATAAVAAGSSCKLQPWNTNTDALSSAPAGSSPKTEPPSSSVAAGVIAPAQAAGSQGRASGVAQPVAVPQLRKRALSRGPQQQLKGSFKAPRMLPGSKGQASAAGGGSEDDAAMLGSSVQQQQVGEHNQQQQQEQEQQQKHQEVQQHDGTRAQPCADAAGAGSKAESAGAAGPPVCRGAPRAGSSAAAVVGLKGQAAVAGSRGNARHVFVPPFRR